MGCNSCASGRGNTDALTPAGCGNKGSCGSGGCNKLNVFDWLSGMQDASPNRFQWVEVRFKNTRKEFFRNPDNVPVAAGDAVAVEASPGHDIGVVSLTGELVRVQMRKAGASVNEAGRKLFRKARPNDIERWKESMGLEKDAMMLCRKYAVDLNLDMKISDVEYQGDGMKATFYYIADARVDFRELIKLLARDLKVRIEMRQIGSRQEAGRVGGIGACGRELCCSSWLTDFRSVTTTAARYQQLSINPQKLAGQCGKLKCCLNYELESYMDALKEFPRNNVILRTMEGNGFHVKTDIFKRIMFFAYEESPHVFHALPLKRVKEIMEVNSRNELAESLAGAKAQAAPKVITPESGFSNVIEEGSLTRFDSGKKKKKRKPSGKNKNARGSNNPGANNPANGNAGTNNTGNNNPGSNNPGGKNNNPKNARNPEQK